MLYTKQSEAIGMFKIDGDGQMDINDIEIFLENDCTRVRCYL